MAKEKYHHDHLKSDLIEKGLKILDEAGYEGFSMRKVAKACNVSHTAPYRHFKNKDELIAAIGSEAMDRFSRSLQEAVDRHPGDPRSQLKDMGYSYIKFFTENPEYLRLIFLSDIKKRIPMDGDLSINGPCFTVESSTLHPFDILYGTVERYSQLIQDKTKKSVDQSALLLYCWGMVHGISILIARKEFPYSGDYLDLVRKILWNDIML